MFASLFSAADKEQILCVVCYPTFQTVCD